MSNKDRGHRPNGHFMTDEEMMRERLLKALTVMVIGLVVALLWMSGGLPI